MQSIFYINPCWDKTRQIAQGDQSLPVFTLSLTVSRISEARGFQCRWAASHALSQMSPLDPSALTAPPPPPAGASPRAGSAQAAGGAQTGFTRGAVKSQTLTSSDGLWIVARQMFSTRIVIIKYQTCGTWTRTVRDARTRPPCAL